MVPRMLPKTPDSPDYPNFSSSKTQVSPDYPKTRTFGSGRLAHRAARAFAFLGHLELRFQRVADRPLGDDAALDLRPRRNLEHRVEQRLLDDRFQCAGAGAA